MHAENADEIRASRESSRTAIPAKSERIGTEITTLAQKSPHFSPHRSPPVPGPSVPDTPMITSGPEPADARQAAGSRRTTSSVHSAPAIPWREIQPAVPDHLSHPPE